MRERCVVLHYHPCAFFVLARASIAQIKEDWVHICGLRADNCDFINYYYRYQLDNHNENNILLEFVSRKIWIEVIWSNVRKEI